MISTNSKVGSFELFPGDVAERSILDGQGMIETVTAIRSRCLVSWEQAYKIYWDTKAAIAEKQIMANSEPELVLF